MPGLGSAASAATAPKIVDDAGQPVAAGSPRAHVDDARVGGPCSAVFTRTRRGPFCTTRDGVPRTYRLYCLKLSPVGSVPAARRRARGCSQAAGGSHVGAAWSTGADACPLRASAAAATAAASLAQRCENYW